jgi:hypothetical protein
VIRTGGLAVTPLWLADRSKKLSQFLSSVWIVVVLMVLSLESESQPPLEPRKTPDDTAAFSSFLTKFPQRRGRGGQGELRFSPISIVDNPGKRR